MFDAEIEAFTREMKKKLSWPIMSFMRALKRKTGETEERSY
jgi:hypothetical protein